mgnify:CR=1 FL=1
MLKSNAICLNYDEKELDEWFGGNIRGKYWTKPDSSFEEMEREPYIDETRYTLSVSYTHLTLPTIYSV